VFNEKALGGGPGGEVSGNCIQECNRSGTREGFTRKGGLWHNGKEIYEGGKPKTNPDRFWWGVEREKKGPDFRCRLKKNFLSLVRLRSHRTLEPYKKGSRGRKGNDGVKRKELMGPLIVILTRASAK